MKGEEARIAAETASRYRGAEGSDLRLGHRIFGLGPGDIPGDILAADEVVATAMVESIGLEESAFAVAEPFVARRDVRRSPWGAQTAESRGSLRRPAIDLPAGSLAEDFRRC